MALSLHRVGSVALAFHMPKWRPEGLDNVFSFALCHADACSSDVMLSSFWGHGSMCGG